MVQLWRSFSDLLPFTIPLAVLACVGLLLWPILTQRGRTIVRRTFLSAWMLGLLLVTQQREMGRLDVNGHIQRRVLDLTPFHDLYQLTFGSVSPSVFVGQVGGNLALFLPLGLYLVMNRTTRTAHPVTTFLIGFGAGCVIEAAQWITGSGRVSSVDDALLAGAGTVLGFTASRAILGTIERRARNRNTEQLRTPATHV